MVRDDPSVQCYSAVWNAMVGPAVLAILVYLFGIPLFFSALLIRG